MVAVVPLTLLAIGTEQAAACSCVRLSPYQLYKRSDAAFVGRLTSVQRLDRRREIFRYKVDRSYKQRLGRIVRVLGFVNNTCAPPRTVGRRYAMFLYRTRGGLRRTKRGRWTSSVCLLTTATDLRRAARIRAVATRGGCSSSLPGVGSTVRTA
jgi:hypothetical protein